MKWTISILCIVLSLLVFSCSMDGEKPGGMDNSTIDQPTSPAEPETPAGTEDSEQVSVSRPYISFVDFINPGTYSVALLMNTAEDNAKIYYTTDGSIPSEDNGSEYYRNKRQFMCGSTIITAVPVSAGCTVKAVTFKDGRYSEIVSFRVPSMPTLDPPTIYIRGEDGNRVVISMQTNDSAATIYFTRDGSTPTTESMIYSQQATQHILPGDKIVTGTMASHGSTVKAFAYSTRYGLTSDITTVYID